MPVPSCDHLGLGVWEAREVGRESGGFGESVCVDQRKGGKEAELCIQALS